MKRPCWQVTLTASFVVRRPFLVALAAFAAPLAAGCYSYTAAQPSSVAPGVTVRARITPAAGERIAPLLGTTPRSLTGKLISDLRDTLIIEVPAVMQAEVGSSVQTLHQRVSVPRSEIIFLEIRELNRARTYGLVGGAALILGWALIDVLNGEPGSERIPGGGGQDNRAPVWQRIR